MFKTAWRHFCPEGWGEGRIAWEKEKSPEFGPQKAEEATRNLSASLPPCLRTGWYLHGNERWLFRQHRGAGLCLLPSPPSGDFRWPHGSASLSESISTFAW